MDELIKQVTEKTGLSDDKARLAVETVIGFLKDKLPAPIAGQLDKVLGAGTEGVGDLAQGMGGILGKK